MTKFEAWQAWCKKAGTEHLALESIMSQSSHGKAFSFAWDAAVKAEREECARICDATRDDEWTPGTNVECAAAIRSRT